MTNLLYICRYNINRSAVARQITQQMVGSDVIVDSAGIEDAPYRGMTPEMQGALYSLGYSVGKHIPKKADLELFEKQDIVLCMDNNQLNFIKSVSPTVNVQLLPGYSGQNQIVDPNVYITGEKDIKCFIPKKIRRLAYKSLSVYDRDRIGVAKVFRNTASQIEGHVKAVVNRMSIDGLI